VLETSIINGNVYNLEDYGQNQELEGSSGAKGDQVKLKGIEYNFIIQLFTY